MKPLAVFALLVAQVVHAEDVQIFSFCDSTGPPDGLRVSSGEFVFNAASPQSNCLARAVADDNTPRMDTASLTLGDVSCNVTFYQKTFYRDTQLCGRVQAPKGTNYNGGVGEGFHSPLNGYCCHLDTVTAEESFLRIRRAGSSLIEGSMFDITFGQDKLYTLQLELRGSDIRCSMMARNAFGVPSLLAAVETIDDALVSGNIAFMPYDVRFRLTPTPNLSTLS